MSNKQPKPYKPLENDIRPNLPEEFDENIGKKVEKQTQDQMRNFRELLNTISSLEDKQKSLWLQIYENAVTDRKNAYLMWADLYVIVVGKDDKHAIHGQTLSKYMERITKANEQIIKLAKLVQEVTDAEKEDLSNPDDMYDRIAAASK